MCGRMRLLSSGAGRERRNMCLLRHTCVELCAHRREERRFVLACTVVRTSKYSLLSHIGSFVFGRRHVTLGNMGNYTTHHRAPPTYRQPKDGGGGRPPRPKPLLHTIIIVHLTQIFKKRVLLVLL